MSLIVIYSIQYVKLYRSPIGVGREGAFFLLKLFLSAFAVVVTGGGGADSNLYDPVALKLTKSGF
jgi:hypothetical protein